MRPLPFNEILDLEQGTVIVALGSLAHDAVLRALQLKKKEYPFSHNGYHVLENELHLIDSYHCSRYNTQTKRLTVEMFEAVFARACSLID